MATQRCKHRHTFLEHPHCYERKPEKIGFFDIESSNLHADFGILLSYAIKELDGDIYGAVISPKELRSAKLDNRIVKKCIQDMRRFDKIITYYGCVTPGHRVLTNNLEWTYVENLKKGDKLLAFSEEGQPWRCWEEATVVHNEPLQREVYEIELSNGEILQATGDHPWLVQRGNLWCWKRTTELIHFNGYNAMQRILPTWERSNGYDEGYLAAFFDGEGGIYQPQRTGRPDYHLHVQGAQKSSEITSRVMEAGLNLGVNMGIRHYDKSNPEMKMINVMGSKAHKLRFLGMTQPQKLSKLDLSKLGRVVLFDETKIKTIKPIGIQMVMGLGTTSKTYVVEGFGSHNTRFDLPFVRTRAMLYGLDFPVYKEIKHTDVYYWARAKLCLHRRRLQTVCDFLGIPAKEHPMTPNQWTTALTGNRASLDYIFVHNKEDVVSLEEVYKRLIDFTANRANSI